MSGTHGKTTTASMIASILIEAKLDPTIIIGGIVNKFDNNNISGNGDLIVVEADEFARSFHQLDPDVALVTCVEAEHLDYYGGLTEVEEAFVEFLHRHDGKS